MEIESSIENGTLIKDGGFSLTFSPVRQGVFESSFYGKSIEVGDLVQLNPQYPGYCENMVFRIEEVSKRDVSIPERTYGYDKELLVYRPTFKEVRVIQQYHNSVTMTRLILPTSERTSIERIKAWN